MDEKQAAFEKAVEYYRGLSQPCDQEQVVELLRETQEIFGCVPRDAQQRIAQATGVPASLVAALVRRFPSLKAEASRHQVVVCTGGRCAARGGAQVLAAVQKALGIRPGQSTPDGLFSLQTRMCFKKCGAAPNLMIDGELFPAVRPQEVEELLRRFYK